MKRPAFQFYPSDWRTDAALQSCSIAARGLWHEMLCYMHECSPYGHLAINGAAVDELHAARVMGVTLAEYRKLTSELGRFNVFSRTDDGVIYSRRMVKDEHVRNVRGGAGRLGGNPSLVGNLVKQTDNQSPTPSSSSSSSTSKNKKQRAVATLPDWLDRERWQTFRDHRKALRKPMTPHAERLLLAELERLRERGYDPPAVIDQSIARSWTGLFPIKEQTHGSDEKHRRRSATLEGLTGGGREPRVINPDD